MSFVHYNRRYTQCRIFFFVKTYFTTFFYVKLHNCFMLFLHNNNEVKVALVQPTKSEEKNVLIVYTTKHTYLSISLGSFMMREILFYERKSAPSVLLILYFLEK